MTETIPRPLVRANQVTIVGVVALALAFQQPVLLSALAAVLLAGLVGGPRWNLIFRVARILLAGRLRRRDPAAVEDAAVQRFNQTLALTLLLASQVAWFAGLPPLGWVLAGAVAVAAGLALAGFCVGCHLYPAVRVLLYRLHNLT